MDHLKIYFLLKWGYSIAMWVYQRVWFMLELGWFNHQPDKYRGNVAKTMDHRVGILKIVQWHHWKVEGGRPKWYKNHLPEMRQKLGPLPPQKNGGLMWFLDVCFLFHLAFFQLPCVFFLGGGGVIQVVIVTWCHDFYFHHVHPQNVGCFDFFLIQKSRYSIPKNEGRHTFLRRSTRARADSVESDLGTPQNLNAASPF